MAAPFKMFYSTDWHAKGKSPETRIDEFPRTIENKIRTFFQMGADLGCDAYGVGGDFVDTSYLSPQYVIRLGKIIKAELQSVRKPVYYILGNHDVMAYDPKSITNTAFGVFLNFVDDMFFLNQVPLEIFPHGRPILLTGVSSYAGLDKDKIDPQTDQVVASRAEDWTVPYSDGRPHIHMVHGYASEKPILDSIPHTVIDEFRHTKATVTLGGHEHTGTPILQLDNGLFCNPGSLGRVFASHAEMNRMPKYMMVTIYPDGAPDLKLYECPVAEAGHLVMNRDKLDEKKAREALLAQVRGDAQEIIRELNVGTVDLRLIFARYKDKVRPAVYAEAMKRIGL